MFNYSFPCVCSLFLAQYLYHGGNAAVGICAEGKTTVISEVQLYSLIYIIKTVFFYRLIRVKFFVYINIQLVRVAAATVIGYRDIDIFAVAFSVYADCAVIIYFIKAVKY